jgi:hypothetical protein
MTEDQYTRKWRSLVRVVSVNDYNFSVVVPGFSVKERIQLKLNSLPSELRKLIVKNFRFHAYVNIGAKKKEDLQFERWEK